MKLTMRIYQDEDDYWWIREFLREVFQLNDRRELSWQVYRFDYWCGHEPWERSMLFFRCLLVLSSLCLLMAGGCSGNDGESGVPADFLLIMDADSAGRAVQNMNIRINAKGEGRYERYDTGGVVRGDTNDMVTYEAEQVVEAGEFNVSEDALKRLWEVIEENHFFELTGDYRMAIGHSYAFIVVEADDRRHQVLNIGMEVPEIKAIVEATETVLPEGVDLEYREGYVP